MINSLFIIQELTNNQTVLAGLLQNVPEELITWRPNPEHWCMLEIVCHLRDIEVEDFRQRVELVLKDPKLPLPPFDPGAWPIDRAYMQQDYSETVMAFLAERAASVKWLKGLKSPAWDNTYQHPSRGPMSAGLFLANWLAHDQLHIRQLNRLKRGFLQAETGIDLSYAGNW